MNRANKKKVHQKIEIAFNFMKEIPQNLFGTKENYLCNYASKIKIQYYDGEVGNHF